MTETSTFTPDPGVGAGEFVDSGSARLLGRVDGEVGWLIFNSPEKRNAVSLEMWAAIPRVLAVFEADPAIRAVIVTGAGGKAFVSGADLSEFGKERNSPEANARYSATSGAARRALTAFPKPTIAMIDGFCIGGGMVVALGCDIRIASEVSKFGIPAARLGLGYGFGGIADLVSLVGPAVARDMLYSARHLPAEEALRVGLINQMAPRGTLVEHVRAFAGQIAANAPMTVRAAKLAIGEAVKDETRRDVGKVDAAVAACFASEDYREGRTAFLQKRTPNFQDR